METRDTLRQALAWSSAQGFVPILRRLAGWLLFLPVLRWQATVNSLPHFGHQAFARDKILRLNCLMKDHSYCAGLDREPPLGHDIVGSSGRHGNYRDACFHRQIERALLKRQQLAIERTFSFYINRHVDPLPQDHRRFTNLRNTSNTLA